MPINFDLGFSPIFRSNFSETPQTPPSKGISGTSSSISWRMDANASEGGICSWLTNLIHQICRLFGLASSETSETSTVAETPLEKRIVQGKQILDNHFQQNFIIHANPPNHSAIIVVMKYNGHYQVSFGLSVVQKNGLDAIKAQLQQLLSEQEQRHNNDSKLEIETLYIEKNIRGHLTHFNFTHVNSWLKFSDESRGGGPGQAANLGRAAIYNQILRAIPPGADQQRVVNFVINQL